DAEGAQHRDGMTTHIPPALPAPSHLLLQPGIAVCIFAGIVGIEVNEDALDLPVADFEHVAPTTGRPLRRSGTPGAIAMLAVAFALADDEVAAGEDPVEM